MTKTPINTIFLCTLLTKLGVMMPPKKGNRVVKMSNSLISIAAPTSAKTAASMLLTFASTKLTGKTVVVSAIVPKQKTIGYPRTLNQKSYSLRHLSQK